jgi:hypothetical protein
MRARIDSARIVTREMKAQRRRDAKMAKIAAKAEATEEVEAPAEETTEE